MVIDEDQAQLSEWFFAIRAGLITASRMCDVMKFSAEGIYKSGPRKGQAKVAKPLKARDDYAIQLAAERLTGTPKNSARAASLDWGTQWEPVAREAYEQRTGVLVTQATFTVHPTLPYVGASPDFLVGDVAGGEIKCPYDQETHLRTLEDGLPKEHIAQIQGGLWVTGRDYWDFVSFHPAYQSRARLYVQRVLRDADYIAKLEVSCVSLNKQIEAIVNRHTH